MLIDGHAHLIEHFAGMGAKGEIRPVGNGKVRFIDGTEMQIVPPGLGDYGFSAEQLIKMMDQAGIDKAVILHGLLYGLQNEYVYESVQKYPDRLIGTGSLDPCIENAEQVIDILADRFHFHTLKFEISSGFGMTGLHPDLKINGKEFERVYQAAEEYKLTLIFDIGSRGMRSFQVDNLRKAATAHSDVKFVLCHLMAPDGTDKVSWENDLRYLASAENIWFDITAMPFNIREDYPYYKCLDYVETARKIVGSGRMIWGSDIPSVTLIADYKNLYDYLYSSKILSGNDLDNILYKTAEALYQ